MKNFDKKRMTYIHTMILEMAAGNFHYQIPRSDKNDSIESLILALNMLAEELQDFLVHQGYVNRQNTSLDLVQMIFCLDDKGKIVMANQKACEILSLSMEADIGNCFTSLLEVKSAEEWLGIWKEHEGKALFEQEIELTFSTQLDLQVPKKAFVYRFSHSENILTLIIVLHRTNFRYKMHSDLIEKINSAKSENAQDAQDAEEDTYNLITPKLRLSFADIRKIRAAHDLIIRNPEKKHPSLKEFALQLGTNEFKFKHGFKELYGMTVRDFIMDQRLIRAQMMVQHSDHPLKLVAHMSGFNSMPHFSRVFKKRYGIAPSKFRELFFSKD